MRGLFVTGTDTGVGKTVVAVALLRALVAAGIRAVGHEAGRRGLRRRRASTPTSRAGGAGNVDAPLARPQSVRVRRAVAPHLAARSVGSDDRSCDDRGGGWRGSRRSADVLIVEGAGGALVPLDARHDMLDIAAALELPVLLVVGMRLGCLNHALLSALAIRRRGLELRGWVANRLAADADATATSRTLANARAPLVAERLRRACRPRGASTFAVRRLRQRVSTRDALPRAMLASCEPVGVLRERAVPIAC